MDSISCHTGLMPSSLPALVSAQSNGMGGRAKVLHDISDVERLLPGTLDTVREW